MIDPKTVTAGGVTVLEVIENTGEGGYSVARVRKDGSEAIAMRWNGAAQEKGYPTARGYPVWFFFPKEAGMVMAAFYRAMTVAAAANTPLEGFDLRIVEGA
jgi:hypothetical protein